MNLVRIKIKKKERKYQFEARFEIIKKCFAVADVVNHTATVVAINIVINTVTIIITVIIIVIVADVILDATDVVVAAYFIYIDKNYIKKCYYFSFI